MGLGAKRVRTVMVKEELSKTGNKGKFTDTRVGPRNREVNMSQSVSSVLRAWYLQPSKPLSWR